MCFGSGRRCLSSSRRQNACSPSQLTLMVQSSAKGPSTLLILGLYKALRVLSAQLTFPAPLSAPPAVGCSRKKLGCNLQVAFWEDVALSPVCLQEPLWLQTSEGEGVLLKCTVSALRELPGCPSQGQMCLSRGFACSTDGEGSQTFPEGTGIAGFKALRLVQSSEGATLSAVPAAFTDLHSGFSPDKPQRVFPESHGQAGVQDRGAPERQRAQHLHQERGGTGWICPSLQPEEGARFASRMSWVSSQAVLFGVDAGGFAAEETFSGWPHSPLWSPCSPSCFGHGVGW